MFWSAPPSWYNDERCSLKVFKNSICINVLPDDLGERLFYFGANVANTPYWNIPSDEHNMYDTNNWFGKNTKFPFEGCKSVCTSRIESDD